MGCGRGISRFICQVCLQCCVVEFFGIWYAYCVGMAAYVKYNGCGSRKEELESTLHAIRAEMSELWVEVKTLHLFNALMELSDVWHASIKYCLIYIFPKSLLEYPFMYVMTFWLALPTTMKHGIRYKIHKCIRNHGNKSNLDHKCEYVS